jgi:formate hydrogenlyase subunit 3/multisubunit Na+/H+ antiporter MnhD subunit
MISPIHIISISLGVAFAIGFLGKNSNKLSAVIMLLTIGILTFISAQWAQAFYFGNQETVQIFTAGYKPPFSINLQIGVSESIIILLINSIGLLGGIYLFDTLVKTGKNAVVVYLIFIMSLNQVVLTQDIFNLFVFLEIQSIATAGLIVLERNRNSISSGFKYMIATGIISSLLLIGIVFGYYFTGSLNIADFIQANMMLSKGGAVALFLILASLLLELKPFPANGWALDVYESIKPGTSAMLSAASASAVLFALYKVLPAGNPQTFEIVLGFGLITFVGSNLLGIKQTNPQRLLGYSSVGQIGLIVAILGMKPFLGEKFTFIAIAIFISHFLAKAGLFWLSGIIKADNIRDWANLRKKPFLLVLFGTFVFTLIGFPPFPSFFGKWELIMQLSQSGYWYLVGVILLGSFFEGIYLFKWLGYAIKLDNVNLPEFNINWKKIIPVAIVGVLTYLAGYYSSFFTTGTEHFEKFFVPLFFIAILYFLDFLPNFVKNIIAIAGMSYYGYILLPGLYETDLLRFIFGAIFIVGGVLTLIAGFTYKGQRKGFHPAALMMFAGLGGIIQASNMIEFFFSWEMMTLGSYILIIRGKKSMPHGLSYMLFSLAGAYLILAAFGFTFSQNGISLEALKGLAFAPNLIYGLLAVGFMTKTASLGLHIWLPGAHAEAESDVSPMVSAILLKAGVFGLIILFLSMGAEAAGQNSILYLLGWLGAITALVGNTAASFQEDAKKLLAYSSIGQLGYILFAFSIMTHLGWLAGFTYSINHFLFKAVLFLAIGAVVLRLKTHNMYEMGGLIKRMPFAFIAVLIGIITLSGVPPLSGFAGKWLFYNAVIEKGWYFQGTIVFFAGTIAFLYSFRLIHSIFLGQLKDNHRTVKDISIWFIIPIYTLIIGIMIFSARPDLILKPIGNFLMPYFPTDALSWTDTMAKTRLGYWDGTWVMIIIGIMFSLIFAWLFILSRKATKVEQFNIAYSGERPERPETTHMAHNIYAGFNKAVGFIVTPNISKFWASASENLDGAAGYFRRIYNGNGQTYALHIIIYTLAMYLMIF